MFFRSAFWVILFAAMSSLSPATADQGGASIVYVSNGGNDTNLCSIISSPCATVSGALNKVATGGTIVCTNLPNGTSGFTVRVSVTIECSGPVSNVIIIDLPSTDSLQNVNLRGLTVSPANGALIGVTISAGANVILEDMVVSGAYSFGVKDVRTSPGKLVIKNTIINRTGGPALVVAGASGNTAVLDNAVLDTNAYGVAVAAGNRVTIARSTITSNTAAGVEADGGSFVVVDGSTISNNNVGVQSGSAIRLSNNNLTFNTTAVSGATGTFGNNRFSGNGSDGTALTPVGGGTTELGEK